MRVALTIQSHSFFVVFGIGTSLAQVSPILHVPARWFKVGDSRALARLAALVYTQGRRVEGCVFMIQYTCPHCGEKHFMSEHHVTMTAEEQELLEVVRPYLESIDALRGLEPEEVRAVLDAAGELTESLLERDVIPQGRLDFFIEPEWNIRGHGKSRREVFRGNLKEGAKISRSSHFLKHLRYFIFGPQLPEDVVKEFRSKAADETFGSRDAYELGRWAKGIAKTRGLVREDAAEEFHKLAAECGLDAQDGRSIRDLVRP
jgi:hypothetical protein